MKKREQEKKSTETKGEPDKKELRKAFRRGVAAGVELAEKELDAEIDHDDEEGGDSDE